MAVKRRISTLVCVCFAAALLATLPQASHAQLMTFERCTETSQCTEVLTCFGFDNGFHECNPEIKECFCMPPSDEVTKCNSSDDCPTHEICSSTPKRDYQFCVGCPVITDEKLNYTAVFDDFSTRCVARSPTPSPKVASTPLPSAELGLQFDLCSTDLPCADAYQCLADETLFPCKRGDMPCACVSDVQLCTRARDCPRGETCTFNSYSRAKYCASCLYVSRDIKEHANETEKCPAKDIRGVPDYPPTSNGLSFDNCLSDVMCVGNRVCLTVGGVACGVDGKFNGCYCWLPGGFKLCETSVDCPYGEQCVSSKGSDKRQCQTRASVGRNQSVPLKVFGKEASPPELQPGEGLTESVCRFDWDCVGKRRCTHREDHSFYGGCAGRRACLCKMSLAVKCRFDSQCARGESCANEIGSETHPYCISSRIVQISPDYYALRDNTIAIDPTPQPEGHTGGLTGDVCRSDTDCKNKVGGSARLCVHDTERSGHCRGRQGCFCGMHDAEICQASSHCEEGEVCTTVLDAVKWQPKCYSKSWLLNQAIPVYVEVKGPAVGTSIPNTNEPVQESPEVAEHSGTEPTPTQGGSPGFNVAVPILTPGLGSTPSPSASQSVLESVSPEPSSEGDAAACIAVKSLATLPAHALVFSEARRSAVLCDEDGNCATRGHMVTWHGNAMMMQTYCAQRGNCTRQRMLVNSPRMRPGLRVSTGTAGFAFTALAARFETDVEEVLLARLVRLGM